MLKALSEHGITPDLVVGTSVGSLNGAAVAADPKAVVNRLYDVWPQMTRDQVFPGGVLAQALTLQKQKTHLCPNTGLAEVITDFVGQGTTFADLTLPFAAVTTDVFTAAPHVVREGPLLPALLASAAIPGIFPPVDLDGHQLYDGGLVANVPMAQAVEMGARSLVVLDCNFPGQLPDSTDSIADILLYTAMVAMRAQPALEAPAIAAGIPVVYVPGPAPSLVSPLDFAHTDDLIEAAYGTARLFLDQLRITGPGLYGSPSS
jgi:NTE family protein